VHLDVGTEDAEDLAELICYLSGQHLHLVLDQLGMDKSFQYALILLLVAPEILDRRMLEESCKVSGIWLLVKQVSELGDELILLKAKALQVILLSLVEVDHGEEHFFVLVEELFRHHEAWASIFSGLGEVLPHLLLVIGNGFQLEPFLVSDFPIVGLWEPLAGFLVVCAKMAAKVQVDLLSEKDSEHVLGELLMWVGLVFIVFRIRFVMQGPNLLLHDRRDSCVPVQIQLYTL